MPGPWWFSLPTCDAVLFRHEVSLAGITCLCSGTSGWTVLNQRQTYRLPPYGVVSSPCPFRKSIANNSPGGVAEQLRVFDVVCHRPSAPVSLPAPPPPPPLTLLRPEVPAQRTKDNYSAAP